MKKVALIFALVLAGNFAVNAVNPIQNLVSLVSSQPVFCKVHNDTGAAFEYKVGADTYTIAPSETAGFNYEENVQILKKDTNGNWVNWFVYTASYNGQSVNLSTMLQ